MPRLSKVTKELNVGLQTCVDFLQKKGHTVENSLNAKITDEQYELLVIQFSSDKDLRQKAEKAQRERLDNRKEAKPTVSVEEPKMETLKNEDSKEEPVKPTFKVVGKIDLDAPKKEAPKKEEPKREEPKVEEVMEPVAEVVSAPEQKEKEQALSYHLCP